MLDIQSTGFTDFKITRRNGVRRRIFTFLGSGLFSHRQLAVNRKRGNVNIAFDAE